MEGDKMFLSVMLVASLMFLSPVTEGLRFKKVELYSRGSPLDYGLFRVFSRNSKRWDSNGYAFVLPRSKIFPNSEQTEMNKTVEETVNPRMQDTVQNPDDCLYDAEYGQQNLYGYGQPWYNPQLAILMSRKINFTCLFTKDIASRKRAETSFKTNMFNSYGQPLLANTYRPYRLIFSSKPKLNDTESNNKQEEITTLNRKNQNERSAKKLYPTYFQYPMPRYSYDESFIPSAATNIPYAVPYYQNTMSYTSDQTGEMPNETPYSSSETSYVQRERPYYRSETPYYQSETPYYHSETPYYHSETPYYQSETPYYQSETPYYQSETPYVQSETPYYQSETPYSSSETSYSPNEAPYSTSEKSYMPNETPYVSGVTSYIPNATPYIPTSQSLAVLPINPNVVSLRVNRRRAPKSEMDRKMSSKNALLIKRKAAHPAVVSVSPITVQLIPNISPVISNVLKLNKDTLQFTTNKETRHVNKKSPNKQLANPNTKIPMFYMDKPGSNSSTVMPDSSLEFSNTGIMDPHMETSNAEMMNPDKEHSNTEMLNPDTGMMNPVIDLSNIKIMDPDDDISSTEMINPDEDISNTEIMTPDIEMSNTEKMNLNAKMANASAEDPNP